MIDLPYFYGGNQDPITWIIDFDKACNANGISDNNKLQVASAYLKGAAATWWTENKLWLTIMLIGLHNGMMVILLIILTSLLISLLPFVLKP